MRSLSAVLAIVFLLNSICLTSAQSVHGEQLCMPIEHVKDPRPMSFDYFEDSEKTERDTNEMFPVRWLPTMAGVVVNGSGLHGTMGEQVPVGVFVSICTTIQNLGTQNYVHTNAVRMYQSGQENPIPIHRVATAMANGMSESDALLKYGPGQTDGPSVDLEIGHKQELVLVFDVDPNEASLFLSTNEVGPNGQLPLVPIPTSESAMESAVAERGSLLPSESSTDISPASQPNTAATGVSGQVSEFDVEVLIHVGMPKWMLTFDSQVEVRSEIGGVRPINGQFLVIWFDQQSQNGDPLPMGNFSLVASTGPDGDVRKVSLSEDGTTALILNEYQWTSTKLDPSTRYRTGIAFDIAPAETHFLLEYDLGTFNDGWGPRKPVLIRFEA